MDMEGAEAFTQRLVLVEVEFLVPEEKNLAVQQRRFDLGEFRIVQAGEIDTEHLGADHGGQWLHVHAGDYRHDTQATPQWHPSPGWSMIVRSSNEQWVGGTP